MGLVVAVASRWEGMECTVVEEMVLEGHYIHKRKRWRGNQKGEVSQRRDIDCEETPS
ncbi:unnamed protein product [Brassica oleracea var. botrytis]